MSEKLIKITCHRCKTEIEIVEPVQEFSASIQGKISRVDVVSFVFKCPNRRCPKRFTWQNGARDAKRD